MFLVSILQLCIPRKSTIGKEDCSRSFKRNLGWNKLKKSFKMEVKLLTIFMIKFLSKDRRNRSQKKRLRYS